MPSYSRRTFLATTAAATAGFGLPFKATAATAPDDPLFKISLAEWSLNRAIFSGRIDHLDFPAFARDLDIDAVEYVNQFFMDKATDKAYLQQMKQRAEDAGVRSLLIMCDSEGALGHPEESERLQAVENHKKWAEAAEFLGCHSIRVNGYTPGVEDFQESMALVADGLRRLCEFADGHGLNVIIENHGGLSSNGAWLAAVIELAGHERAGTMPDFGNFRIREGESYDSYHGVAQLMPYAPAVSVKPTAWDAHGEQHPLDYVRMMRIVLDAGYRGYCGIEHGREGEEAESIREVKLELENARTVLQSQFQS
jgi:sugar phosphate isomerase/epimerase